MSRKKRTSRKGHRKVRRNQRFVLVNRARGALRSLARNVSIGGVDVIEKIVFPALGATGGMLLSQWLGTRVAPSLLPGQDQKFLTLGAAAAAAYGAYALGDALGLSPETQMTVAAGAGVTAIVPWVPTSMLPASLALAVPSVTPAPTGTSGYYQRSMLGGLMVDVSHAGAPYKGMLGLGSDPADQDDIDDVLHMAEAVSTVEPVGLALPVISKKTVRRVREQMGTPGDRGWAGGIYARNLFGGS